MKTSIGSRVGIMGGTFDPIHFGHLILGERAYEAFHLDSVLFLPNGNPPHKQDGRNIADISDRLEMVRLAIAGNPHFVLDEEETRLNGYGYTRDTLERLHRTFPEKEFFFIIGEDSLMSFHYWYKPEEICRYCTLLVADRGDVPPEEKKSQIQDLERKFGAVILEMDTPKLPFASSEIREMCREGRSVRYYVPEEVYAYISSRGLYR